MATPPYQPPSLSYRSGTLSYTVPQEDVVHMWCNLDLTCKSAASDDWVVCSAVGFSFDRLLPSPFKRFCGYMNHAVLAAGPGFFRALHGEDSDGIPSVECVALPDYRWLVWVNTRETDGMYEFTLWRAEDVETDQPLRMGPGIP